MIVTTIGRGFKKNGFTPTRHYDNALTNPREDGCNYVATHFDDFMVVAKYSKGSLMKIKETFNLRSEDDMDYFLGCNIRRKRMSYGKHPLKLASMNQLLR